MPGPPEELEEEIATALRTWDELVREGCELRFVRDPCSGRLAAELYADHGEPCLMMGPRDVLALTTGLRDARGPRAPSR